MYEKYTIQKGEDLRSIANKFNTLEETILDINNIPFKDMVREGMEIIVPKESEKYFEYYTIQKGDNIYKIARQYNINPELLSALNGLEQDDYIYPNQKILIPRSGYSYYITKEGDTLSTVSRLFGVKESELTKQNQTIYLQNGQMIFYKRD